MMYDPKTGKGIMAKTYQDHLDLADKGYVHEKPKNENRSFKSARRDAMRGYGNRQRYAERKMTMISLQQTMIVKTLTKTLSFN